jgi:hypothetical protein
MPSENHPLKTVPLKKKKKKKKKTKKQKTVPLKIKSLGWPGDYVVFQLQKSKNN